MSSVIVPGGYISPFELLVSLGLGDDVGEEEPTKLDRVFSTSRLAIAYASRDSSSVPINLTLRV